MKKIDPKEIQERILSSGPVEFALHWAKTHSFPGFFKVPLFDVLVFIYNEIRRFDLTTRANAIAFSFFLALFPFLIFILTLVPYFSDYILSFFGYNTDNFLQVLEVEIQQILPGEKGVGALIFTTISDLATKERFDLLSIGFILAIYFSSNGMLGMMRSFEKSYDRTFKKRSGIRKRLVAILLTVQLSLLMIASVLLVLLGRELFHWIDDQAGISGFSSFWLFLVRWITIILVVYTAVSILYRYGASTIRRFSMLSPGATLATLLIIIASVGFSFYVDNYANFNRLYGPISAIIIVMLWIQINSLILLMGFELNASIAINRDLKAAIEED